MKKYLKELKRNTAFLLALVMLFELNLTGFVSCAEEPDGTGIPEYTDDVYWYYAEDEQCLELSTEFYAGRTSPSSYYGILDIRENYTEDSVPWADLQEDIFAFRVEENSDTVIPYSMSCWFAGMENLQDADFSGLDTCGVVDMSYMFKDCSCLPGLSGGKINTSMCISLEGMFFGCELLSEVDTSEFNTACVEDFSHMFEECSSLQNVDLSGFDSSSALTAEAMFSGCTALEAFLPGSSFTCSLVTNMNDMFRSCESLTEVDLSEMTPSALTTAVRMFEDCTALSEISFANLSMQKLASMSSMFRNCASLADVCFTGADTERAKALDNMFAGCISLVSVDLTDLDVGSLRTLSGMFRNCESLESVRMPAIQEADSLRDMSYMFSGCSSLKKLAFSLNEGTAEENIIEIDTSKVTDMTSMLEGCYGLTQLELDIDMLKVKELDGMLRDMYNLTVFTKGAKVRLSVESTGSCADLGAPDPAYVDGADGYWYQVQDSAAYRYLPGDIPNKQSKQSYRAYFGKVEYSSSGYGTTLTDFIYYDEDYRILGDEDAAVFEAQNPFGIARESEKPMWTSAGGEYHANTVVSQLKGKMALVDEELSIRWKGEVKATYSVVWKNGETVLENGEAAYGLIPEYHGETPVKSEAGKQYKFTGWDPTPAPVTEDQEYQAAFEEAVTVTWMVDADTVWATESVVKGHVPSDPGIPVKPASGGMDYEFDGWDFEDALTAPVNQDTVYTAKFTSSPTVYLYWGLQEISDGLRLLISANPVPNAKHAGYFRKDCGFTSDAPWYYYRKQIISAAVLWDGENSESKVKPTSTRGWFAALENLKSADLSGLNTSDVTDMADMFCGCKKLTALDVTGFDTRNTEDFSRMFAECIRLTSLDVSRFNTAKAECMNSMFKNMLRVKTLNVSGFDTSNVENFHSMFEDCYYLETADVSDFKTGNARDFGCMFEGCSRLKTINLSGFDTGKLECADRMLFGCRSVSELDLSRFAITGNAAFEGMLSGTVRLSKITLGTAADLSTAALATPSDAYIDDAEGFWFDTDNKACDDGAKLAAGKTYRAVYGWVEYSPNGGTGETFRETLHYKDRYYALPKQMFTKEGKVFVGWSRTTEECTASEYRAGQTITREGNGSVRGFDSLNGVKLYATWRNPKEQYGVVIWKDYDDKTVLYQSEVLYGSTPVYPYTTPTRGASEQYTYTFREWTPEIKPVSGAETVYKAEYDATLRTYTVIWKNGAETLETDYDVPYGQTPAYNGNPPVKQEDESYAYTFSGWNPSVAPVTGNKIYYAQFTPHQKPVVTGYTITWTQDDGETVLGQTFTLIGDTPEYGITPTKTSTEVYNYTFSHWSPTPVPVTGEATYTAVYTAIKRIYTVTYDLQGHGSGTSIVRKERVDSILTKPVEPTDSEYTFCGWYFDQACTKAVDFSSYTMPAKDITVYASWTKTEKSSGGSSGGGSVSVSTRELNVNRGGATFSSRWTYAGGKWLYPGKDGTPLTSCWLCDDAVVSNRFDVWYLLGEDGTMLDAGLVQDLTGNYYSLEMRHNGYYGMLRYQDGEYDGIYLQFEHQHNGSFGAIKNKDGIEALKKKYGVTKFAVGNGSCVYTSSYEEAALP